MPGENILDTIVSYKLEEIEKQKKELPQERIKEEIKDYPSTRDIIRKIQENIVRGRISLIAEVKKASPSKGIIRKVFNPVEIAKIYEASKATAISVLTDRKYFQGSVEYLTEIKKAVNIPVLRKDFIIDSYQVYQSRHMGADLILLISSILEKGRMSELKDLAQSLGMGCLVEVHTQEELEYELDMKTRLIGINNRDLKTFKTDVNHTVELISGKHTCKSFIVSESGINNFDNILKLSNAGVTAVLIGERFMREDDIAKAISEVMNW